jgi:hypothetical protein
MIINILGIILFFVIVGYLVNEIPKLNSKKNNKMDPLLDFRQTACFGDCPVYSSTIYKDGTVRYYGEHNVKLKGKLKFKISEGSMFDLKNMINKLNVLELKEEYDSKITDLPSTFITFYLKNKNTIDVIKIRARDNIPKKLQELIDHISLLILNHKN